MGFLAGMAGVEPATFRVRAGRCYQLSYIPSAIPFFRLDVGTHHLLIPFMGSDTMTVGTHDLALGRLLQNLS